MSLKAFYDFVLPVKDKLYRFALRFVKDPAEADDIVQDVLIKVWKNRQNWDRVNNMEAFMMKMTRNLALDQLKSKDYRSKVDIEKQNESVVKDTLLTPDSSTEMKDLLSNIHKMIDQLPEKQKMIIQLRDIEGCTYQEISDNLELDMNQVKVNLFRARKSIRESLNKLNSYGINQNQGLA